MSDRTAALKRANRAKTAQQLGGCAAIICALWLAIVLVIVLAESAIKTAMWITEHAP